MRKETDELRSVIKEKTNRSLDRIVRRTDSLFIMVVLECPMSSKFCLPQLELFDGLKDPLDHLNTFKTTLGLSQPPDEILYRSFPTTSKELRRCSSRSYQHRPLTTSSNWVTSSYATLSGDNTQEGRQTTCLLLDKKKRRP